MAGNSKKLSVQEKLDQALEFKEKGNGFYKEGNFKSAAKNYHKAILYLKVSCCKSCKLSFYVLQRNHGEIRSKVEMYFRELTLKQQRTQKCLHSGD